MELVYLWIENYKNIHRQGFNFSPRFRCDYNPDKNELTIEEKKDYVPNFFGENINITAIVGKNGSGKSSVLEIIAQLARKEFLDFKTIKIYFANNQFLIKSGFTKEKINFRVNNYTSFSFPIYNNYRLIDTLYFSNEVATIFNKPDIDYLSRYGLNAFYSKPFVIENAKYIFNSFSHIEKDKKEEKIRKIDIFNERFKFILKKDKNILSLINQSFIFDSYKNEIHFYELSPSTATLKSFLKLIENGKDEWRISTTLLPSCKKISTVWKESFSSLNYLKFKVEKKDEKNCFLKLLIIYRLDKLSQENLELNSEERIDVNEKFKKMIDEIIPLFHNSNFSTTVYNKIKKIIDKTYEEDNLYSEIYIEDILKKYKISSDDIWIEKEPHSVKEDFEVENPLLKQLLHDLGRINFINSKDGYNYFELSGGEKAYLEFFVTYIYWLYKNKEEKTNTKYIFLFDEIELGLHPIWQKKIFNDIYLYAQKITQEYINLIFTTHSPFLLSDIPKQNIIFLDKYKGDEPEVLSGKQKIGNCKVVDGLKEKKQTFGANIHTLLSDSFFMEDGLMGEFAKGKIDEIIKILNSNELSQEQIKYCEQIISIIGEPILKRQLQKMLDSKRLKKVDKIDKIEKDILELQQELERLKNEQE